MPYLIDGHNLIGNFPGLSLADMEDELDLIRLLQQYCRKRGKCQVEVFFDNAPAGFEKMRRFGQVTAYFVPAGNTADAAITRRLHQLSKKARNWTVVSSDRQVIAAAKSVGAQVVTSDSFAKEVAAVIRTSKTNPPIPDAEISEAEVEEWLKIFQSKLQK